MSLKRIHPSFSHLELNEDHFENTLDDNLSEYETFSKKIKKDFSSFSYTNQQGDLYQEELDVQNDSHLVNNNLYGQQFENLKACSFQTIPRIGQDKNYAFIKNQVAESQEKIPISNQKRRHSFINHSQQKSKQHEIIGRNILKNARKSIASFGSLNEISILQKKNSVNDNKLNLVKNSLSNIQPSNSGLETDLISSINTQMMNDMLDFTIKDENQVDKIYLERMIETALIGEVEFIANLRIVKLQFKNQTRIYSNLTIFKLIDVDGFSIKSFYVPNEQFRINLDKSITNKDFKEKLMGRDKQQIWIKQKQKKEQISFLDGQIQFSGSYYDLKTHQSQKVKFYISEMRQAQRIRVKKEEMEDNN